MTFSRLLLAGLMLLPGVLLAEDSRYQLIHSDETQDSYADLHSISRSGNMVEAWFRSDMKKTVYLDANRLLHHNNTLFRVDCEKAEMTVVSIIAFDDNNQPLLERTDINEIAQASPGSPADQARIFLCEATP